MLNFSNRQTSLDLNGPILSFVQQPSNIRIPVGLAATFTGIATATFPTQTPANSSTNTGFVTYRWYDQNGPLFDDPSSPGANGLTISGAGTTVLTLYNNQTSRNLFLTADYVPSAYGTAGVDVTVGSARSTGNAINELLSSNIVSLIVDPNISISGPADQTVIPNDFATFTVTSNNSLPNLSYQWLLNGSPLPSTGTLSTLQTPLTPSKINVRNPLFPQNAYDINFAEGSGFNLASGELYYIRPDANIPVRITAVGGSGGRGFERNVAGGSGGTVIAEMTLSAGQTYTVVVGSSGGPGRLSVGGDGGGHRNYRSGGDGGFRNDPSAYGSGGGGGGGFTGLFLGEIESFVIPEPITTIQGLSRFIQLQSSTILIAGGGGGGANAPSEGGGGGGVIGNSASYPTNVGVASTSAGTGGTQTAGGLAGIGTQSNGSPGAFLKGGNGMGGGGGGYYGGGGGGTYAVCCSDGGGGGGSSYFNPGYVTSARTINGITGGGGGPGGEAGTSSINTPAPESQGSFLIEFLSSPVLQVSSTISVSGANSPTLRISSSKVGLNNVQCIVSHPSAINSPVYSRIANFSVVEPRGIINVEDFGGFRSFESYDLEDGPIRVDASRNPGSTYTVYAPERNVRARVTIAGAAGASTLGNSIGGEGGVTVFDYTFERNVEYVFKMGSATFSPKGGDNGGGGATMFYKKGVLVAVVGGGGGAGNAGPGGAGGGVNLKGLDGGGRAGGVGGINPQPGVSLNGQPASGKQGGQTQNLVTGDEIVRLTGVSPGADFPGTTQARDANNNIIRDSAYLKRGYKPGNPEGYRTNGGNGSGNEGGGGSGAFGGNAGTNSGSGGGGGSGYGFDSGLAIVSTRTGGNPSTNGYIIIEKPVPIIVPTAVTPSPSVSLSASSTSINLGQSITLSWSSSNATTVDSSNFGASTLSGSITVTPPGNILSQSPAGIQYSSVPYQIYVSGPGGQSSASVTININSCAPDQISSTYGVGYQGYIQYGNGAREGAIDGSTSFITEGKQEISNTTFTNGGGVTSTYDELFNNITSYYGEILTRLPDAGGFDYWVENFANGTYTSYDQLKNAIFVAATANGEIATIESNGRILGVCDKCNQYLT